MNCGLAISKTFTSWTILPAVAIDADGEDPWRPGAVAVVIQICLPQMTGDDQPLPWMAVFQTTFSVSLQVTGRPCESLRPSAVGPRKAASLHRPEPRVLHGQQQQGE